MNHSQQLSLRLPLQLTASRAPTPSQLAVSQEESKPVSGSGSPRHLQVQAKPSPPLTFVELVLAFTTRCLRVHTPLAQTILAPSASIGEHEHYLSGHVSPISYRLLHSFKNHSSL